jgi:hypothetical protein
MNKPQPLPDLRARWRPQASASNNGDFISIETYSSHGLAIGDPIANEHLLTPDASEEDLGLAILDALKQSRFLSLEEEGNLLENAKQNYLKWVQKIMNKYGYKTKRALFKNMKNCGIDNREGIITIRPSHHEKLEAWDGEGFTEQDDVKVPADSPPAEIGAALRLAFSRCTG